MEMQIKVAKIDNILTFDVESLPPASIEYLVRYGLTQALNDAHASIARKNFANDTDFHGAVWDKVAKRNDQILTGNVPGVRTPVTKEAKINQLATALNVNPVKLAEWMESQAAMGRAA